MSETAFEGEYLKFSFSVADKQIITHKISIPHLLSGKEMPEIKQLFILPVDSFFHLQILQNQNPLYPLSGILLDKSKSDENTLAFTVFNPHGQFIEKLAPLHNLINLSGIEAEDFSEVLYIGQSRKMGEHAMSHEKIQQALAEAKDVEDIYVYFFDIKEKRIIWGAPEDWKRLGFIFCIGSSEETFGDVVEITDEGRINLVEMALINYFKPKYNTTFVNSRIPLNKQVNNLLRENNYTRMIAEISFDSVFYRFGSSFVRPKQHHSIVYKLDQ